MSSGEHKSCYDTVNEIFEASVLSRPVNLTEINFDILWSGCKELQNSQQEDHFSKPMVWIGVYIAVASLLCVLAMTADLLHGFRNRKFWFPCKYFTLNAASITIITIAMKLPVDMNTPIDTDVYFDTKMGSLIFMSTMMANLMPSLASMNNMELLANGTGLVILSITLIVNTLIEVDTGLLPGEFWTLYYAGEVICLLVIFISTAITIPTVKQILESKYQVAHTIASNEKHPQHTKSSIEELGQHVRIYWVMAKTSDPQFVMANTPFCFAACVISVPLAAFHLSSISYDNFHLWYYESPYGWSVLPILITQCIGIAVGNIAALFRCFAALGFKLSFKWTINHIKVFTLEKYCTEKLSEWKGSHIAFPLSGRILKALVYNLKSLILCFCIGIQKAVVVICKMIGLIPVFLVLVMYSLCRVKKSMIAILCGMFIAKTRHNTEPNQNNTDTDINNYVLLLEDETKLAQRTVKRITNSLNRLMQKAEKKRKQDNLMKLLQKSTGFKGVESFDSDQVQPLAFVELINCWSLPVVTLTCIAIALPNIRKDALDCLINSVGEGLSYTQLVDESLNITLQTVNIQKLISNLWDEVDVKRRWLKTPLKGNAYKGRTLKEIVKFFHDKAKETVDEIQNNKNERALEKSRHKLIAASSMYRITETLTLKNQCIIEQNSEEQLFDMLCSMIADILVACLTNLPHVIEMKCDEPVIEKREASVEAAAELLGGAKEMISMIQTRELPSMDPNQMASIDEWRNYLKALP